MQYNVINKSQPINKVILYIYIYIYTCIYISLEKDSFVYLNNCIEKFNVYNGKHIVICGDYNSHLIPILLQILF